MRASADFGHHTARYEHGLRVGAHTTARLLGTFPSFSFITLWTIIDRYLFQNGPGGLDPVIAQWTTTSNTSDFEPDNTYCDFLIDNGFGSDVDDSTRKFWRETIKSDYQGDAGRRRIRMAAINLSQRDGLHARLSDVRCPVLWLHGTEDAVYSVANAKEEIEMFTIAASKELRVVEGGKHFLSFSHPQVVDGAVKEFVGRHGGE